MTVHQEHQPVVPGPRFAPVLIGALMLMAVLASTMLGDPSHLGGKMGHEPGIVPRPPPASPPAVFADPQAALEEAERAKKNHERALVQLQEDRRWADEAQHEWLRAAIQDTERAIVVHENRAAFARNQMEAAD